MANSLISMKVTTPVIDIANYLKQETDKKLNSIMDGMCEIGRSCVRIAKNLPQNGSRAQFPAPYTKLEAHKPNYVDWTTNLRKSISWAVLNNGIEYKAEIGEVQNARDYYNELKSQYSNGLVLLVMATGQSPTNGSSYARYVQALGYDVLSSAQLEMQAMAKQIIQSMVSYG